MSQYSICRESNRVYVIQVNVMSLRGSYWVFTLNNWTREERTHIDELVSNSDDVTYLCYGVETGEGGTPHLQGYLELQSKSRRNSVSALAGLGRAYLDLRKGSQAEAIEYTEKEGDYHEFGSKRVSKQGARNDLIAIKDAIDSGQSDIHIADNFFGTWTRSYRALAEYRALKAPRTDRPVKVIVIWGAAGTGKTRYIFAKEPVLWISSDPTLKWFDGYQGEPAALIDDFRGESSPAFLLRLLDRYPLRVPVKGSFAQWLPERIYITSNVPPPFGMVSIEAPLLRRLHVTIELSTPLNFDDESELLAMDSRLQ